MAHQSANTNIDLSKPLPLGTRIVEHIRNLEPGAAVVRFTQDGRSSALIVRNLGEGWVNLGADDLERWEFAKALISRMCGDPQLEDHLFAAVGEDRVWAPSELTGDGPLRWHRARPRNGSETT